MKLNKIASVLAGAALAIGAAAPASAVTLTAGDLKITINAFDAGTTGYLGAGTVCNTVASCDAAGTFTAPNSYGSEDTWGIFSVQSISRVSNGQIIFNAGDGGQYMTGMFGGIADTRVSNTVDPDTGEVTSTAYGTGGWLNMYYNSANYDSSQGPTGRTSQFEYTGITGGTLALSAVFASDVSLNPNLSGYTYRSQFGADSIAGGGQGFLDVTGGSLYTTFNTDKEFLRDPFTQQPVGPGHDLFLKVTYAPSPESAAAGWTVDASGDVQANALPEPASIAVFGLGLAGIAGLRRRKSK